MKFIGKIAPLLIMLAAVVVYAGSFSGVFIFDDYIWIVDAEDIRSMWTSILGTSRPLIGLTLYFNYLAGGLKAADYHAVNLVIHIVAGLLLYGILGRTFKLVKLDLKYGEATTLFALIAALLWVVHPLQTESVTYIIQRSESLMGMFYLLTLYCFIRGACEGFSCDRWFTGSIVACALGMACKPVMLTAPVMVLLYDRIFVAGSFREAAKQRKVVYLGLFSTLLILVALLSIPNESSSSAGFGAVTVGPLRYVLTQAGVVLHYVRLAFWPADLCLDYDWEPAGASLLTCAQVAVMFSLLGVSVLLFIKKYPAGFIAVAFFLLLFPSSSFVPLSDCAAEHRMYLPLACVILLAGMLVLRIRDKWIGPFMSKGALGISSPVLVMGLVVGLGLLTIERNRLYQSELQMWTQVVSVRPGSLRGCLGLGSCQLKAGLCRDAEASFLRIVNDVRFPDMKGSRYATEFAMAYSNLGVIRFQEQRFADAEAYFVKSLSVAQTPAAEMNLRLARSLEPKKDSK